MMETLFNQRSFHTLSNKSRDSCKRVWRGNNKYQGLQILFTFYDHCFQLFFDSRYNSSKIAQAILAANKLTTLD